MTLQIFTARLSPSLWDPDLLDITRQTAARARKQDQVSPGEPFAPSWAILTPAIEARRQAEELLRQAKEAAALPETASRPNEWALAKQAEDLEASAWATYAPAYRAEMRQSYRRHRPAWEALLARERVVLACVCVLQPGEGHCHRRLLAGYLAALGAEDRGEIA